MGQTVRFGVSMDAELLAAFDSILAESGYANRSEAVRDFVRQAIVRRNWDKNSPESLAVLCTVRSGRPGKSPGSIAASKADTKSRAEATLQLNLSQQDDIEIRVLRGPPRQLEQLANHAIGAKGIRHGCLIPIDSGSRPS